VIRLEGVSYRYAGARAPSLRDLDLELGGGEVVGLVGASESGKTTLCLVLAGLAPRAIRGTLTGRLLIDGEDMTGRPMHELAALVGIGFQDPVMQLSGVTETVYEEVAFGPANLGVPRGELIDRVEGSLARLRIEHLAARDPARLSGGQQQLVAMAGLLAMRPRHLVLDEPTAQLDPGGTRLVMDAVRELAVDGASILIAEHKVDELARVCSRALVVEAGAIVEDGPADAVLASPGMRDRGLDERSEARIARMLHEAGLDPVLALAGAG
jgi:energy-coupling factor transport system ATP-binding protein